MFTDFFMGCNISSRFAASGKMDPASRVKWGLLIVAIVMLIIAFSRPVQEFLWQGPSWYTTSSGSNAPALRPPHKYSDSIWIRRWRTAPMNNLPGEPRQLHDDTWAQNNDSGIGFQLG